APVRLTRSPLRPPNHGACRGLRRKPRETRCRRCLTLPCKTFLGRKVTRSVANNAGEAHELFRGAIRGASTFEMFPNQLTLRHADPRRGLFDPSRQLFCRTKSNCLTHMAEM